MGRLNHENGCCDKAPEVQRAPEAPEFVPHCARHPIGERQRGWKTQGGWKTYRKFGVKPLPKNVWTPPPTIRFPPLFGISVSFPLKERGTDQTNPNFWGLQKWFWRAHSPVRFPPPPQMHVIRFAPPLSRCPTPREQRQATQLRTPSHKTPLFRIGCMPKGGCMTTHSLIPRQPWNRAPTECVPHCVARRRGPPQGCHLANNNQPTGIRTSSSQFGSHPRRYISDIILEDGYHSNFLNYTSPFYFSRIN